MSKSIHAENLKLKKKIDSCDYILKRSMEKFNQCIFSENKQISDIQLINGDLKNVLLSSLVQDEKLVYRFYKETCWQCIEDELDITKQLADSIGKDNILIISDFDQMSEMKALILQKKIKSPYFIFPSKFDLPIENDKNKIASFFLIDKNLKTRFVFKAGGNQYIEDSFYKRIISFFKTGF